MNAESASSKCPSSTPYVPQIMTAKEVAEFLKISVKTVYSYAEREMMPVYWRFQRNVRFERRQIIEWIEKRNDRSRTKPHGRVA